MHSYLKSEQAQFFRFYFKVLIIIMIVVLLQACHPKPILRPGPAYEGSAKWGFNIAQPLINEFANDAQLYCITGGTVYYDGRLPRNTGSWHYVTWSPSQQRVFEVTVKYDGTARNTTRNEVLPVPPVEQPIPPEWVNSTNIFSSTTSHQVNDVTYADVAFNLGNAPQEPEQAVWSINFHEGQRHLVKWDGSYLSSHADPYQLISPFLRNNPNVHRVMNGIPYNMDDPEWIIGNDQNKNIFAYKIFAAFHIVGYETGRKSHSDPHHLRVLNIFQSQYGFPVDTFITRYCIRKLDLLLLARELKLKIELLNNLFPLHNHMQPLHYNDISKNSLAVIYNLPMRILPEYLRMSKAEMAECIRGQCLGFIHDADGNEWPVSPVDINADFRFVGAYFNPFRFTRRLASAAICMHTVLHEYAHYLDGCLRREDPNLPKKGIINTLDFYNISYYMETRQLETKQDICVDRRSDNPQEWITRRGFIYNNLCPPGKYRFKESWPDAFAMYVAAGENFRVAALQNTTIATKYNWLKTNVFQDIEYDTNLPCGLHSGCNDIPGAESAQPGYTSCDQYYVWDGELRKK